MSVIRIPTSSKVKTKPNETDFILVGVPTNNQSIEFEEVAEAVFGLMVNYLCTGTIRELEDLFEKYKQGTTREQSIMKANGMKAARKYTV
jgi:hypothetical protein